MNIYTSNSAGGTFMGELLVGLLVLEVLGTILTGFSLLGLFFLELQKRKGE